MNRNLQIKISKLSNLLFYVKNSKPSSPLSSDLQTFLSDNNIDVFFFEKNESKIWAQIKKIVDKQHQNEIKRSIEILKPDFLLKWVKIEKNLKLWKKQLNNKKHLISEIFAKIKKLLGIENFSIYQIPIYLIYSTYNDTSAWFSWTCENKFIVVEIPIEDNTTDELFSVGILTHEIFHLALRENKKIISLINQFTEENESLLTKLSNGMPNRIFLEELLLSSFIPEGYLGEKYLNQKIPSSNDIKPKNMLMWRRSIASKMQDTSKKYTDDNKQIDNDCIQKIIDLIKPT
ncbi:MAG: hypothetical protein WCO84_04360 [bacterium]